MHKDVQLLGLAKTIKLIVNIMENIRLKGNGKRSNNSSENGSSLEAACNKDRELIGRKPPSKAPNETTIKEAFRSSSRSDRGNFGAFIAAWIGRQLLRLVKRLEALDAAMSNKARKRCFMLFVGIGMSLLIYCLIRVITLLILLRTAW